MTEASRSDRVKTTAIDWRMSAALQNVPRGVREIPEVTSLETAVRAWRGLDAEHRHAAVLTPERPIQIDGSAHVAFAGEAIDVLTEFLPSGE